MVSPKVIAVIASFLLSVEVELFCAKGAHDGVENAELQGREGTNHDTTRAQACRAEIDDAHFFRDIHHSLWDRTITTSSLLIHFREERVRGVGDDGRNHASDDTGGQAHA